MNKKKKIESLENYIEGVEKNAVVDHETLNKLISKVNELIDGCNHDVKYLNQYIEALKFLMWFDWNKLSSQKLIDEAKNKLIEDLSISDNNYYLSNISKLEDENEHTITLGNSSSYGISINSDYCFQRVPNIKILKKPKHQYRDYVKAVVANPNNYGKEAICKVVNYLKQVIETNKTLQKYDV